MAHVFESFQTGSYTDPAAVVARSKKSQKKPISEIIISTNLYPLDITRRKIPTDKDAPPNKSFIGHTAPHLLTRMNEIPILEHAFMFSLSDPLTTEKTHSFSSWLGVQVPNTFKQEDLYGKYLFNGVSKVQVKRLNINNSFAAALSGTFATTNITLQSIKKGVYLMLELPPVPSTVLSKQQEYSKMISTDITNRHIFPAYLRPLTRTDMFNNAAYVFDYWTKELQEKKTLHLTSMNQPEREDAKCCHRSSLARTVLSMTNSAVMMLNFNGIIRLNPDVDVPNLSIKDEKFWQASSMNFADGSTVLTDDAAQKEKTRKFVRTLCDVLVDKLDREKKVVKLTNFGRLMLSVVHGNDRFVNLVNSNEPDSEQDIKSLDTSMSNLQKPDTYKRFHYNRSAIINEYMTNLFAGYEKHKRAISISAAEATQGSLVDYLLV